MRLVDRLAGAGQHALTAFRGQVEDERVTALPLLALAAAPQVRGVAESGQMHSPVVQAV